MNRCAAVGGNRRLSRVFIRHTPTVVFFPGGWEQKHAFLSRRGDTRLGPLVREGPASARNAPYGRESNRRTRTRRSNTSEMPHAVGRKQNTRTPPFSRASLHTPVGTHRGCGMEHGLEADWVNKRVRRRFRPPYQAQ